MREFDEFEKRIIRKLKEFKEADINTNFLSLLDDLFVDRGIEIKKSTREGWIYFDAKKFAYYDNSIHAWIPKIDLSPEAARTTGTIIRMIFLLEYLEKNGIVFLYDFSQPDDRDVESFPEVKMAQQPLRHLISEKKVIDLIIHFFYKEIVISQSIIMLVNNNFLTKEEIHHSETIEYANRSLLTGEKSIKVANRAINVSIALGVISVFLSLYSVMLNKQQIDQLERSISTFDNSKPSSKSPNQVDSVSSLRK